MWGLLGAFLPYILGTIGLLVALFGIKRWGAQAEKAKWEKATNEAKEKIKEKVLEATGKDSEIDKGVEDEKAKIKEANKLPIDSDSKRFRF